MGAVHVTSHAVLRYQERVANVSEETARATLSSTTIARAADFGAPFVKLGTGQHVVLRGRRVVTVIPAETSRQYFATARDALHEI